MAFACNLKPIEKRGCDFSPINKPSILHYNLKTDANIRVKTDQPIATLKISAAFLHFKRYLDIKKGKGLSQKRKELTGKFIKLNCKTLNKRTLNKRHV